MEPRASRPGASLTFDDRAQCLPRFPGPRCKKEHRPGRCSLSFDFCVWDGQSAAFCSSTVNAGRRSCARGALGLRVRDDPGMRVCHSRLARRDASSTSRTARRPQRGGIMVCLLRGDSSRLSWPKNKTAFLTHFFPFFAQLENSPSGFASGFNRYTHQLAFWFHFARSASARSHRSDGLLEEWNGSEGFVRGRRARD